ncbi:hypothetical protein ACQKWADRAFT_291104 [Trichoderma austrokoningii]
MQLSVFGTLLALAIGPAAATDSITFDVWFSEDGSLSPVPCGPETTVGFDWTVSNNSCSTWTIAFADSVTLAAGQTIPASLQTNDEQTCTVYWIWSTHGVVSPSCADTVLATTAELAAGVCYQAPNAFVFGLNIKCEPN